MSVGGDVEDNAPDITYSTKPNNNSISFKSERFVTNSNNSNFANQGATGLLPTKENIMGVGGGVGDEAVDVTYSTKPDIINNNINNKIHKIAQTTTEFKYSNKIIKAIS